MMQNYTKWFPLDKMTSDTMNVVNATADKFQEVDAKMATIAEASSSKEPRGIVSGL